MRSRSRQLATLLLVAVASMGQECQLTQGADPGAAPAGLLPPDPVSVSVQDSFPVEFRVTTNGDFRAFDVKVDWDPAVLSHLSTEPHPDFDPVGPLSAPGNPDPVAGHIQSVRDVRLGGAPASGEVGIVRLWFRAEAPGATKVSARGWVADGNGLRSSKLSADASVSVGP